MIQDGFYTYSGFYLHDEGFFGSRRRPRRAAGSPQTPA
jgi:hypothetical protein